ncbi:AraC family transcriptional regulator [Phocaeicola coprophilus]|nr:AraC family transcriptional regulator [Phocaeicola coprophilus]
MCRFFYYEKLCLTPKYLTTVIKKESGVSAADWIERYVILQAQALLKSTDLTIQQISDKLNFSSQVFFGKYFKRLVGMSPKEYRKTL